jgi:hypothetical protein
MAESSASFNIMQSADPREDPSAGLKAPEFVPGLPAQFFDVSEGAEQPDGDEFYVCDTLPWSTCF